MVHTDHWAGQTVHTKQVVQEILKDGYITEEPVSELYRLSDEEFKRAVNAYAWNEVLGKPTDYIKNKPIKKGNTLCQR